MAAKKAPAGKKKAAKSATKKAAKKPTRRSTAASKPQTKKKTTKKTASPPVSAASSTTAAKPGEPSHEQIAALAFTLWEARGKPIGEDQIIWHEAEAQLRDGNRPA